MKMEQDQGVLIRFGKLDQHPTNHHWDGLLWQLKFERGNELLASASDMRDILQGWINKMDGKPFEGDRIIETINFTNNFGLEDMKLQEREAT